MVRAKILYVAYAWMYRIEMLIRNSFAALTFLSITFLPPFVKAQQADRSLLTGGISPDERNLIEAACRNDRLFRGPAAYYACQKQQLTALQSSPKPSLDTISSDEQNMI